MWQALVGACSFFFDFCPSPRFVWPCEFRRPSFCSQGHTNRFFQEFVLARFRLPRAAVQFLVFFGRSLLALCPTCNPHVAIVESQNPHKRATWFCPFFNVTRELNLCTTFIPSHRIQEPIKPAWLESFFLCTTLEQPVSQTADFVPNFLQRPGGFRSLHKVGTKFAVFI